MSNALDTCAAESKRPRASLAQQFLAHLRRCRERGVDARFLSEGTGLELQAILADYIILKGTEGTRATAALRVAVADAIVRPKGVTPDSALPFVTEADLRDAEERRAALGSNAGGA